MITLDDRLADWAYPVMIGVMAVAVVIGIVRVRYERRYCSIVGLIYLFLAWLLIGVIVCMLVGTIAVPSMSSQFRSATGLDSLQCGGEQYKSGEYACTWREKDRVVRGYVAINGDKATLYRADGTPVPTQGENQ